MREDHIEKILAGDSRTFYLSYVWQKKREKILKRDNYECKACKEKGRYKAAETVHHIKELKEYPELGLTDENLISLCNVCHNEIHGRFGSTKRRKGYTNVEKW